MKRRRMFRKNGTKTKRPSVVAENKEAFENFDDENPEDNDEFDKDCDGGGDEEFDTEMDGGAFSSNYSTGSDSNWSCSSEDKSSEYSSYESSDESMERPVQKLVNWPSKGKLKRVKLSRKSDYSQPKSSRGLVSSSKYKKGRKSIHDPRYNEQELCAALMVIIKVMKMDEAKPFNVPADPAALGTSDYVNVIDTPMDFGTIYSNLQNGTKYLNSEDVYKDVQLIWRHWCKYNYKGDYVLELMTSVKKKFMKHWIAANLYCEPTQKTSGHSLPPMQYDTRRKKYVAKYPEGHMIGGPNQSQPQLIKNEPYHSQKLQQSISQPQASQPQAGSDIGSIANSPPHAGHTNDSAGQSHLPPRRDHGLRRKNYMLNRPVGPMINNHSQPKPQQPILSFNQSYHLQQPQQATSQAQPSQPQADSAGQSPTNSVMGCSNYKSSCPSGPVINNPGPQQQIQEAPECHNNKPCKSVCKPRKKRCRGPSRCLSLWDLSDGERIDVSINRFGQPIGREAAKLSSFMGTIARNGYIAPLTYVSWRAVPDAAKEDMWLIVQSRFNIDPKGKSWVMKSLATKWRSFKSIVKAKHEQLRHRDRRVLPHQWPILISHWNSEREKVRTAINKACRAKMKDVHTLGSKSYARLREEEREKRPNGEEPTRDEIYILTHTHKDGKPVNEEAAAKISKLRELASQQPKTSNDRDDIFFKVMGQEKPGYVRTYGLVPAPSDVLGSTSSLKEAKMIASAEMSKMVEKMEAMEQRYTCMEAQITKMTSYMEIFLKKEVR
ncbi:hypothetical protein ACJW31_01G359000 [Castanea mollissima]